MEILLLNIIGHNQYDFLFKDLTTLEYLCHYAFCSLFEAAGLTELGPI